jgi:hypothetical protein
VYSENRYKNNQLQLRRDQFEGRRVLTFSTPGPYNSRNVHMILVYHRQSPVHQPSLRSNFGMSSSDSPSFQPHSAHRRAYAESPHCWLEIAIDLRVQSDSVAPRAGEAGTTITRKWYEHKIPGARGLAFVRCSPCRPRATLLESSQMMTRMRLVYLECICRCS